ncbi:MAG: hypothetical protein ABDH28_07340, partial [Brevinematia bacterium]
RVPALLGIETGRKATFCLKTKKVLPALLGIETCWVVTQHKPYKKFLFVLLGIETIINGHMPKLVVVGFYLPF